MLTNVAKQGNQSDDTTSTVYQVNAKNFDLVEDMLRDVVTLRVSSFYPVMEVEDVLNKVRNGEWIAYVATDEGGKIFGVTMCSIRRTGRNVLVMIIEFTTLQDFYKMSAIYDAIECLARDLGCKYIEAVAHPTIAEYAVKRKGFTAPNVHIRKAIAYERIM